MTDRQREELQQTHFRNMTAPKTGFNLCGTLGIADYILNFNISKTQISIVENKILYQQKKKIADQGG